MAPTFTPERELFRQIVADIAAKAKETLPEANGRVDKAVALVLQGDVELLEDGSARVFSQSDGITSYHTANGTCTCKDVERAPSQWCKHRIAAGILTRVQARMPQAPPVEWPEDEDVAAEVPTAAASQLPLTVEVRPNGQPLPEARSSANVRLKVCGHEVQITLRDHDEAALMVRLEELIQRYGQPPAAPSAPPQPQPLTPQQHNAAAMHRPTVGFCAVHNVNMQQNEKDGRHWFSHYDQAAGKWCKGR